MPKRLAPALAWPLHAQALHTALSDATSVCRLAWVDWSKQPSDDPLSVEWSPNTGEITVWIRPVASDQVTQCRTAVEETALLELATWVTDALAATDVWKLTRHERRWTWNGRALTSTDASHPEQKATRKVRIGVRPSK